MFETFSDDAQGKSLDTSDRFLASGTISKATRQARHFTDPSPVILSLGLDLEPHALTIACEPLNGNAARIHPAVHPAVGATFSDTR